VIEIEQSRRPDRTRHALGPILVELSPTAPRKITVPRLHFSETTAGNMRKKGKPNPNQRYFSIILTLVASVEGGHSVPLCAMESERIIVRAANLNVFSENEAPLHWTVGTGPQSIIHFGHVGINTDSPTEALTVNGNVQVSGAILQPSDKRVKEDIEVADDSAEQLHNVRKLKLYRYNLKPEWATQAGRADDRAEFGMLAQEVAAVLPDAVRHTGRRISLGSDGVAVDDLLVVNKDRIWMENVGAVQELGKLTDRLSARLKALEAGSTAVAVEGEKGMAVASAIMLRGPSKAMWKLAAAFLLGVVFLPVLFLVAATLCGDMTDMSAVDGSDVAVDGSDASL